MKNYHSAAVDRKRSDIDIVVCKMQIRAQNIENNNSFSLPYSRFPSSLTPSTPVLGGHL